ncbi:MAG: PucR family transcriptional regulator [Frankiales bacterium]|nr:PucR family transcriptional regulator [Frankiales bacterium]
MDLAAVAQGAADDAGGLDTALLGDFLQTVVDAAGSGRRLRSAELETYGERGAAAATAGVPLRATVDLYLSASWRLWAELPLVADGTAAQVRAAGLAVLRAADDGVAALCEGYQLARNDLSRRQESGRREVFDALLAGGAESRAVLGRAADLGVDLTAPHAVLVASDQVAGFDSPGAAALLGRLERSLQGRRGDAAVLLAVKNQQLVCIFNAPDPEAIRFVSARLTAVLGPGEDAAPRTWQAAVGRPAAGADGVRASYEQALDALALAGRLRLPAPVVDAAELVVFRVLLRDRPAIDDLIATALGPLAAARGGAEPLLATLEAYYATGGVATEAARRLHLSVRAVTYRLARVARLLGVDPTDPAERFALHAAVLAARLLDWPGVPLDSSILPGTGNEAS